MKAAILVLFIYFASLAGSVPAEAQATEEKCINIANQNGAIRFVNVCPHALSVAFMTLDDKWRSSGDLAQNEFVDSGLTREALLANGWIGWACRQGEKPDIAFSAANQKAFIDSKYSCVK